MSRTEELQDIAKEATKLAADIADCETRCEMLQERVWLIYHAADNGLDDDLNTFDQNPVIKEMQNGHSS